MVAKLVACTGQNSFHCCCRFYFDHTPVNNEKKIWYTQTRNEFIDRIHFIQSNAALQNYKHHSHTHARIHMHKTCVCTILSKADFCLFHYCCRCCCCRWWVIFFSLSFSVDEPALIRYEWTHGLSFQVQRWTYIVYMQNSSNEWRIGE